MTYFDRYPIGPPPKSSAMHVAQLLEHPADGASSALELVGALHRERDQEHALDWPTIAADVSHEGPGAAV